MNEKQTWHDAVRKAGGIVHSDGNIFFTDYSQMEAAVEAMKRIAASPARIETLRKALFESRDAMRLMADWVKKSDPAAHSWGVRMVDRANAALSGDESASPAALTFAYGVEAAAKWVEQRRANFDAEHGSLDPSTGTMEYGQGAHAQAKLEYAYELVEIEEGIRGILAQAASAIQRCVTCGGAKIDADPLRTGTCDCPAPASPADHPGDKQ